MKIERFNEIIDDQVAHSLIVLAEKGKEYAPSADRLDHFKDAAVAQGISPKQALWGMLAKHLASLSAMCKSDIGLSEFWQEKITDSMNYLLLLWALVKEDSCNAQD